MRVKAEAVVAEAAAEKGAAAEAGAAAEVGVGAGSAVEARAAEPAATAAREREYVPGSERRGQWRIGLQCRVL